ncbi:hypothetical protein N7490_007345 [Penicillium lividum]|nr:hypothetical protein N7490_007345 [Penicillium lividum]
MTSQMFFLNGQPITMEYAKQLHPHRKPVHRLGLESGLFRSTIPPSDKTVIVKQRKDGWEKEFGHEEQAYQKLVKLQGIAIPKLYGRGFFNGYPALMLSHVAGTTLYDLARNETYIEDRILEKELKGALRQLYEHGAEHWDRKLDNFMFCDNGKVMVVDLEEIQFPSKRGAWEDSVNLGGVHCLMSDFRDIRKPNRPSSPISFWTTRPDDKGALGTAGPSDPAQLIQRGNDKASIFSASGDTRKGETVGMEYLLFDQK